MMMNSFTYHADSFDVEAVLPNGTPLTQFTTGFDRRNRPIRRVAINRSHIGMNLKVKVSLRGCGNSCWGHAAIEDKLAPLIGTCPCEERITGYTGTIPSGTPTFDRPNVGCGTFVNGVSYVTRSFAVDSTGIYPCHRQMPRYHYIKGLSLRVVHVLTCWQLMKTILAFLWREMLPIFLSSVLRE